MYWENVRNVGNFTILTSPPDGRGVRILKPFLEDAVRNFAKQNVAFFDDVTDLPLFYSERSLQNLLAVAIDRAGATPFAETPIGRRPAKRGGRPRRGSLDSWVRNGNDVYLIEVKHGWVRIDSDNPPAWVQRIWERANEQIQDIDPNSLNEQRFRKGHILRIAFMSLALWRNSRKALAPLSREQIQRHCMRLIHGLDPQPNWAIAWEIHSRVFEKLRRSPDPHLYDYHDHLAVLFVANIGQAE